MNPVNVGRHACSHPLFLFVGNINQGKVFQFTIKRVKREMSEKMRNEIQ